MGNVPSTFATLKEFNDMNFYFDIYPFVCKFIPLNTQIDAKEFNRKYKQLIPGGNGKYYVTIKLYDFVLRYYDGYFCDKITRSLTSVETFKLLFNLNLPLDIIRLIGLSYINLYLSDESSQRVCSICCRGDHRLNKCPSTMRCTNCININPKLNKMRNQMLIPHRTVSCPVYCEKCGNSKHDHKHCNIINSSPYNPMFLNICHICNEVGHYKSMCTFKSLKDRQIKRPDHICPLCHEQGHYRKECHNEEKVKKTYKCPKCFKYGHFGYECLYRNNYYN